MLRLNKTVLLRALALVALLLAACVQKAPEGAVRGVEDLPGRRIGVQLGTTGDLAVTDYEARGSSVERFSKSVDAIQALKVGAVDCVVIDEMPARAFAAKNPDLHILETPFVTEEYAIALSPSRQDLLKSLNQALADLIADGTRDAIAAHYLQQGADRPARYQSPPSVDRSRGRLTVATAAEFEPYEYVDKGEVVGIDIDLMRALCDRLGFELVVEDMAFDSILAAVQSGKADVGIAGMTVTEERQKRVAFTRPYASARQVIVVRAPQGPGATGGR